MGEIRDISPGQDGYNQTGRQKRVRTSFKHHQLRTMKSYFALNQNPDAKDLKQLSQKTGLSKRVLQVSSVSLISCTLKKYVYQWVHYHCYMIKPLKEGTEIIYPIEIYTCAKVKRTFNISVNSNSNSYYQSH